MYEKNLDELNKDQQSMGDDGENTPPQSPNSEPPQDEKKNHTKRNIAIVVGMILASLLLLLGLKSCGSEEAPIDPETGKATFSTEVDDSASDPLKGLSDDEIEDILNEKVEQGMINISMNTDPVFPDGTSEGSLAILNDPMNNYPQVVEIFLRDTEEKIYESALIPVGKTVAKAKLSVDLDKGDYPCTAFFHNVDPDTGESLGKAGAEITIHIAG